MAKRRKRKWLYEEYKMQHPEIYGQHKTLDFSMVGKVGTIIYPVIVFILLNLISVVLMMLVNTDIREWIIRLF